jgi:hypothetical protein
MRERDRFLCAAIGDSALAMRYTAPPESTEADLLVVVNLAGSLKLDLSSALDALLVAAEGRQWSVALPVGDWYAGGSTEPLHTGQVAADLVTTPHPAALVLEARTSVT